MASTKSGRHFFGGIAVEFAIDADDAAEGRDGIGDQGFAVGLQRIGADADAAGVGVLDDGDGGLIEFLREFPAGVEVDEVVVAELLALDLESRGNAGAGAVAIEGGALMGILAVAQRLGQRVGDAQHEGKFVAGEGGIAGSRGLDALERVGDGGIVGAGNTEGTLGETPAGFAAEHAAVQIHFVGEELVVVGRGDDGDVFEVFGGGAEHGGAADVDVLDEVFKSDAGVGGRFFEGVEVDDDHVDGLDAGGLGLVAMLLVAAHVENAAVHFGVQCLDAAVEHLGEAGEVGDLAHGEAGIAQGAGGATGRNEFSAVASETLRKIHDA